MSWPMVALGEISQQIRGVTYQKSDAKPRAADGYEMLLRANNITDDGIIFEDVVYVPSGRVNRKQVLAEHDIVIAASSGSLKVVGKSATFRGGPRVTFGAFCKAIRPDTAKVDPRFFSHVFRTPDYRRHVERRAAGANINNLRNEDIAEYEIPLPPLEEQRRIAGILDAADALRRRRREALALLDTLPGAIFAEMFGDYKNDRHSWGTVSFSDACIDRTSRSPKVKARDYCSIGKLPVVDQGAALIAGFVDDLDMENVSPLPVVIFGDHTRHVKLVDFPFATGADGAKVLEPGNGFIAEYLAECIRALPLPDLGYSRHMRELKRLEFPKPPVDQQMTFARQVACINEQRHQYERDIQELETLFASLQSRAFAGEL